MEVYSQVHQRKKKRAKKNPRIQFELQIRIKSNSHRIDFKAMKLKLKQKIENSRQIDRKIAAVILLSSFDK